jgi:hypothetical protein
VRANETCEKIKPNVKKNENVRKNEDMKKNEKEQQF